MLTHQISVDSEVNAKYSTEFIREFDQHHTLTKSNKDPLVLVTTIEQNYKQLLLELMYKLASVWLLQKLQSLS